MLSSQVCPACTPAPGAKLSSVHREKEVADGAVVCFPVWLFSEFAIEDSHLSHVWGISSAKFLHSFYFISLILITAWPEGKTQVPPSQLWNPESPLEMIQPSPHQ